MSFHQVLDNRVIQSTPDDEVYSIQKGANSAVYTSKAAQTFSSTGITFQLPVCSKGVGRTRQMYLHCTGYVLVKGDNLIMDDTASGTTVLEGKVGLKPFPLNRNFTVEHTIGSATETLNTYQLIDIFENLNVDADKANYYENIQPDLYSDYNGLFNTLLNPLSNFNNAVAGSTFKPRNIGITQIMVNEGKTEMKVYFDIIEPLITPFSLLSTEDQPALFNIPSEQIVISSSGMNDMLAIITPQINTTTAASISSYTTTVSSAELYVCYVSMDPSMVASEAVYTFPSYNVQSSPIVSINNATRSAGNFETPAKITPATESLNVTVNYSQIPDKVVFVARQSPTSREVIGKQASLPDRFLVLTQPQVNINNLPSSLNNAPVRSLFDISKRNGYANNYEHFAGLVLDNNEGRIVGQGSVLVLDPVLDLGITSSGLANDVASNYTLTGTFNVVNNLVEIANVTPKLSQLVLSCVTITRKQLIRTELDYISRPFTVQVSDVKPVLALDQKDATPLSEVPENDVMHGAGFGSFLHNAFKWGMKNKNKILDAGKKALELKDAISSMNHGGFVMGGSDRKKTIKLHKYK